MLYNRDPLNITGRLHNPIIRQHRYQELLNLFKQFQLPQSPWCCRINRTK